MAMSRDAALRILVFGSVLLNGSAAAMGGAAPVRSSVHAYSNIGLTVVGESDIADQTDDQSDTIDPLGPLVSTATINSTQGFYTAMCAGSAEFSDANHGSFNASQSYMGMRASGEIQAQAFQHTLEGILEYDFTIPDDGTLHLSGLVVNGGPSSISYFGVVQIFSENAPGSGFAGPFFEMAIRDLDQNTEAFDLNIPLNASTRSYRMRIRLAHSGLGQLNADLSAGSLSASWTIDSGDACRADLTGDGALDFFDIAAFVTAYSNHDPIADFSADGVYDFFDISAFLSEYTIGCP